MPLLYQQNINENSTVALWRIEEPEEFFLQKVSLQTEIHHPHKRLQHLAGRYVLQMLDPHLPVSKILRPKNQKPYLHNEPSEFSISHCEDYAAAILSTTEKVGLDIETIKPKIINVVDKFLTAGEKEILCHFISDPLQAYTVGWSIKEALFKWLGIVGVDFKKHLHIEHISCSADKLSIDCRIDKSQIIHLKADALYVGGLYIVWVSA